MLGNKEERKNNSYASNLNIGRIPLMFVKL